MKFVLQIILFLITGFTSDAQMPKIKIKGPGQLNNKIFTLPCKTNQLFTDEKIFYTAIRQVKDSISDYIEKYDFSPVMGIYNHYNMTLAHISLYHRMPDSALMYLNRRKPFNNNRITTGIPERTIAACQKQSQTDTFRFKKEEIAANLSAIIKSYDWNKSSVNLLSDRKSWILNSPSWQLSDLSQMLNKYGDSTNLRLGILLELLNKRFNRDFYLPAEEAISSTYTQTLKTLHKKISNIWLQRTVSLDQKKDLHPIFIAVIEMPDTDIGDEWKSLKQFQNRLFVNTREIPMNGKDDDNNGWTDDIHGISYYSKTSVIPVTLPSAKLTSKEMEEASLFDKGQIDVYNMENTKEASWLINWTKEHSQDEYWKMFSIINTYKNIGHQVSVSAITIEGNPAARLMINTNTLYKLFLKDTISLDSTELIREIEEWEKQFKAMASYLKDHNVRVVNMSWGFLPSDIEQELRKRLPNLTSDQRTSLCARIFGLIKSVLISVIQSQSEILFVCSSGNEGYDLSKIERIPQSYDLPNLIVVGMVDAEGKYSGGNYGKKVDVYAYGSSRDALMIDGKSVNWTGTSLAAPEIANLAGKLLAVCPKLSVIELRNLILNGSDEMKIGLDEKAKLLNPKKSFVLLENFCKQQYSVK